MERLYVLLPAYNEAANIATVVADVRKVRLPGVEVTALVVNDGSKDDTAALAAAAGATVISHPRNRGVGAAFRTGIDRARADGVDYLVHMDSDGQVPAWEIPILFGPVGAGECDLAVGSRFLPGTEAPQNLSRWKSVALTTVARSVGLVTGYRLTDLSCGFRCMNRMVIEAINPTFDYDYIQETLIQALAVGARVKEVAVTISYEVEPVRAGMSGHTWRYGRRFLGLTAFSLFHFYKERSRRKFGG